MTKHLSVVAVAMAFSAITCQQALADTTTLICNSKFENTLVQDEPTTVELNEANGTVIVHYSGIHLKDPQGVSGGEDGMGGLVARTIGPLPAQFGTSTITFSYQYPNGNTMALVINRLTGDFSDTSDITVWRKLTCHLGKAQF